MAFTLEVAESEIENLKDQVTETKKIFHGAIQKIDRLELNMNNNNIILTKLDMTQNETLKAVQSLVENGGTRCVERGFVIQQIEDAIGDLKDNQCKNCKHEITLAAIKNKQKSLRNILGWMLAIVTSVLSGWILWYFTIGQHVSKVIK